MGGRCLPDRGRGAQRGPPVAWGGWPLRFVRCGVPARARTRESGRATASTGAMPQASAPPPPLRPLPHTPHAPAPRNARSPNAGALSSRTRVPSAPHTHPTRMPFGPQGGRAHPSLPHAPPCNTGMLSSPTHLHRALHHMHPTCAPHCRMGALKRNAKKWQARLKRDFNVDPEDFKQMFGMGKGDSMMPALSLFAMPAVDLNANPRALRPSASGAVSSLAPFSLRRFIHSSPPHGSLLCPAAPPLKCGGWLPRVLGCQGAASRKRAHAAFRRTQLLD